MKKVTGRWGDNNIQFPRLICEIAATQNLVIKDIADSMDLDIEDVVSLFERAHIEWERIKERDLGHGGE